MKKIVALLCLAMIAAALSFGETGEAAVPMFQAGLNLGTDVLPTGENGAGESWQKFGFQPDLSIGPFGIGLDLTLRFQLYPEPDEAIRVYQGDWVPGYNGNGKNFLDVYLPKLLYIRYGMEGKDPLAVKVGSIDDLSLGGGFIMSEYSNMSFMPDQRFLGLDFVLDGSLFKFPYVGLELLTGNLARFDVLGGRVFVRPLVGTEIPVVKNLEIGAAAAIDRDPYIYDDTPGSAESIAVYGLDLSLPLLGKPIFSAAFLSSIAFEPNGSTGFMTGFGGKFLGLFSYGLQLRAMGAGFIPSYFDANYDLYRAAKADYMQLEPSGDGLLGWFASIGTSILDEKIVFNAAIDGPMKAIDKSGLSQADFPHLRGVARLGEGLLGGFYADARYEKYNLGKVDGFFSDIADPTDAIVGLAVNYKTGASVLTVLYDAKWVNGEWKVSSSLQAALKF